MQAASTRHIAGAQHHIGMVQGRPQGGQAAGVVREVGVHRKDLLVAHGQDIVKAHEVGSPQAQLAWTVQHAHPTWKAMRELLRHLSGPVRGVVVDNQDVERPLFQNAGNQAFEIPGLVVRRDDDYILPTYIPTVHKCLFRLGINMTCHELSFPLHVHSSFLVPQPLSCGILAQSHGQGPRALALTSLALTVLVSTPLALMTLALMTLTSTTLCPGGR